MPPKPALRRRHQAVDSESDDDCAPPVVPPKLSRGADDSDDDRPARPKLKARPSTRPTPSKRETSVASPPIPSRLSTRAKDSNEPTPRSRPARPLAANKPNPEAANPSQTPPSTAITPDNDGPPPPPPPAFKPADTNGDAAMPYGQAYKVIDEYADGDLYEPIDKEAKETDDLYEAPARSPSLPPNKPAPIAASRSSNSSLGSYKPVEGHEDLSNEHQLEVMKMVKDGFTEDEVYQKVKEFKLQELADESQQAEKKTRRASISASIGRAKKIVSNRLRRSNSRANSISSPTSTGSRVTSPETPDDGPSPTVPSYGDTPAATNEALPEEDTEAEYEAPQPLARPPAVEPYDSTDRKPRPPPRTPRSPRSHDGLDAYGEPLPPEEVECEYEVPNPRGSVTPQQLHQPPAKGKSGGDDDDDGGDDDDEDDYEMADTCWKQEPPSRPSRPKYTIRELQKRSGGTNDTDDSDDYEETTRD